MNKTARFLMVAGGLAFACGAQCASLRVEIYQGESPTTLTLRSECVVPLEERVGELESFKRERSAGVECPGVDLTIKRVMGIREALEEAAQAPADKRGVHVPVYRILAEVSDVVSLHVARDPKYAPQGLTFPKTVRTHYEFRRVSFSSSASVSRDFGPKDAKQRVAFDAESAPGDKRLPPYARMVLTRLD